MNAPHRLWKALGVSLAGFALAGGAQALELKPELRLHLDHGSHQADSRPLADGWITRRASLGIKGKFNDDWSFEAGYELASKGAVRLSEGKFKDVSLEYRGWRGADIALGQFKLPFSLEEQTGSNDTRFIERALPVDAFAPSRRLGVGISHQRPHYTVSAMAFGASIGGDDRGRGFAARVTAAPIHSADTVLHLGLAAVTEKPRSKVDFDAAPEARVADVELVNTGGISDVSRIHRIGVEAAWRSGPVSVQAEWLRAHVRRDAGRRHARLAGWYLAGSWVLTGELRPYKNGRFKEIDPRRSTGAWELTARHSRIDLDDGAVRGGWQRNTTLGLNYHVNEHLRVMLNYIRADSQRRGRVDDPAIVLLRVQWAL